MAKIVAEDFKDIPKYEGRYQASRNGQIKSLLSGRILKPATNHRSGRLFVNLSDSEHSHKTWTIHRLVMLTYVGELPSGIETRHLDGDFRNNNLDNLAYGTKSDNMNDAVKHGTQNNARKTHCPRKHEYTLQNTVVWANTGRRCRKCETARTLRRQMHRKIRANFLAI